MPKDEFDFEDPMELNGVAIVTEEDTTQAMTECFVQEFMRLGHNHKQILALFKNPHYLGMNMALQNRGEAFVRNVISEVFARWGKPVHWPKQSEPDSAGPVPPVLPNQGAEGNTSLKLKSSGPVDPMGAPPPDLTL
jgi:hypothetical protein